MVARDGFEIVRERLPSDLRETIVSAMAKVGYRLVESPQAQEPYRAPAPSMLSWRFEPDARLRPRAFGRVHVWRKDDRTLRVEPTFTWLGLHSVGWSPTSVLCSLALFAALLWIGELLHAPRLMHGMALLPAIMVAFGIRGRNPAEARRAVLDALGQAVDQLDAVEVASPVPIGRVRVAAQAQGDAPSEQPTTPLGQGADATTVVDDDVSEAAEAGAAKVLGEPNNG